MKLNMVAPNLHKGFIRENNEAISYLELSEEWTQKALAQDIKAGAKQFQECLVLVEKHSIGHTVVIKTNTMEDGLMAVSYLSAISKREVSEGNQYRNDELDVVMDEPDDSQLIWVDKVVLPPEYDEEEPEERTRRMVDVGDEIREALRNDDNIVPVISYKDLINESTRSPFGVEGFSNPMNPFATSGITNRIKPEPYWTECTKQDICIMIEGNSFGIDFERLETMLLRFSGNRHVYVVWKDERWKNSNEEQEQKDEDEDDLPYMDFYESGPSNSEMLFFVLKTGADVVQVSVDEKELKKYRLKQFDDWAEFLDIRFEKGFPKRNVVDAVIRAKIEDVSTSLQMVLQYVQKESGKAASEVYTEKDFDILKKFNFRVTKNNRKPEEIKSLKSLEKDLIGMETVKKQLKDIVEVMKLNRERERMGLGRLNYQNVHLLIGAPGTAKTTVAQLFGKMMSEEGLLPGDRFISVNGAELKGMYVGHSAPKTKFIFEQHDVILIDEAYSLTEGEEQMDTFSKEALAQLILEVEKHGYDKLIMFAGYGGVNVQDKDNKMKRFLDANPGLKSRINSTIYFDSYTPEQMVKIVHKQAELEKLKLSDKADKMLFDYFTERVQDTNFGNGREGRRLVQNAVVFMAERIMKLPKEQRRKAMYQLITAEDVEKTIEQFKRGLTMQNGRGNRYGFL